MRLRKSLGEARKVLYLHLRTRGLETGESLCSSHTLRRSSNSDQIKRAVDLLSEPIEHTETQPMTSSLKYTSQTTLGSVRVGRQEDL